MNEVHRKAISRRGLLKTGSLAAIASSLPLSAEAATRTATPARAAATTSVYEAIGVRPVINCRGTYTIIGGSQTLPEVKQAMDEASRHYVQLDELMEGVGRRLAELTGAEWGIVTAGCAAAITNATAACLAGGDPEKMQQLPDLRGLKNEVIIPTYSRNVYDHATRMLGVRIVEVETEAEMRHALGPQTAMVYVMTSPTAEKAELNIDKLIALAAEHKVPVFIDAAAETPSFKPNIYLARGATFVGYSGGKCMRGPQCAGLLLGRKDLVQAAWMNSAPHHAFGRSLKVGKEEVMGMLAAAEQWSKRDHDKEWAVWMSWLDAIAKRVTTLPSVTTSYLQPEDMSNHAPQLKIEWDASKLGITGTELVNLLGEGTPRIFVGGGTGTRPAVMTSSIVIMPYMMMPEDHPIVADALYKALSSPPHFSDPVLPTGTPVAVAGEWELHIAYKAQPAVHRVFLEQKDTLLRGEHEGALLHSRIKGEIHADQIAFDSHQRIQGADLEFHFKGTAHADSMQGVVALGEYGTATWSAKRL